MPLVNEPDVELRLKCGGRSGATCERVLGYLRDDKSLGRLVFDRASRLSPALAKAFAELERARAASPPDATYRQIRQQVPAAHAVVRRSETSLPSVGVVEFWKGEKMRLPMAFCVDAIQLTCPCGRVHERKLVRLTPAFREHVDRGDRDLFLT